jgi:hypothetical protein
MHEHVSKNLEEHPHEEIFSALKPSEGTAGTVCHGNSGKPFR